MQEKKRFSVNLQTRLICLLLFITILPLAVFGTILFYVQRRITASYAQLTMEQSVEQMATRLSQELSIVENLGSEFYLDEDLRRILSADTVDAPALDSMNTRYNSTLGQLNVQVYFLDTDCRCYGQIPYPDRSLCEKITQKINPALPNSVWFTCYDLDMDDRSRVDFYIARPLHDADWNQIGTLIIYLPQSELRKLCSGFIDDPQNLCILDQNGNILLTIDNQNTGYIPNAENCTLFSGSYEDRDFSEPELVTYDTVSSTRWKLILSAQERELLSPYSSSNVLFLAILILYLVVAIVLIVIVSRRYVRPIRQLTNNIRLAAEENLLARVPVTSGDEIGQLAEQYNNMLQRIQDLIDEQMEAQQAQHAAEMQALQAQINPHFIYNTLATIRYLVFANRNKEADQALVSLVDILRGTLSNPHYLSTVGHELKIISDYIYLQRISLDKELDVTYDVDDSVLSCPLCKLTLQPIVENSFIHGFKPDQESYKLDISARSLENCVHISVHDNGSGFTPPEEFAPAAATEEGPSHGLGLGNVQKRLQLAFGEQYGLTIESAPGIGTTVHIIIPKAPLEGDVFIYDNTDSR